MKSSSLFGLRSLDEVEQSALVAALVACTSVSVGASKCWSYVIVSTDFSLGVLVSSST
jgi:hypothetical protein